MSQKKDFLNFLPSLTKDFILAYRIAIFGIAIVGFLFLKFSFNQKKEEIENQITSYAKQAHDAITADLDYIRYQIFYAAKQVEMFGDDEKKIAKLLSAFVPDLNNQIDAAITWNAFSWINKNNMMSVDGAAGILAKPVDVSGRDYLESTKNTADQLIFGNPVQGALSQRLVVPAGIGVFTGHGKYFGTLVFGLDVERMITKLENAVKNDAVSFAFLKDKTVISTSTNFENKNLSIVNDSLAELKNSDTKKFLTSQDIFHKQKSFIFFQKVKNYPLSIVVIFDKEKSYRELSDLFFRQLFFVILVGFACIILFKRIYHKVVEPVSQLSQMAVKISEKNFSFEIAEPRGKEFRELYQTLLLVKNLFVREENLLQQLHLANQKISQENFNKSEFLAGISHDIRNPLSAISSFSHMICEDKEATKDEIMEWAQDIENCATEALQFINDLMDVNQVASGEFSIDLSKKINIVEVIQRSIRLNRDFSSRRKIQITENIQTDLPLIKLDARRMKQIMVNLISNSIKYSKEGAKIEIDAREISQNSRKKLQIIVQDYGFGMSEIDVKKALEKYGRIKNENSDKVDSFGLGLPLVKHLVEAQNGEMKIESVLGKGTKISLIFG